MLVSQTLLIDVVVLAFKVQQFHLFITASQLICWSIAVVVGILTRILVGRRMAFGVIGTFVAALIGVWLATTVIVIGIPHDVSIYDIPLLRAFLGAIVLEVVWYLMTYRSYRAWAKRRNYAKAVRATPHKNI